MDARILVVVGARPNFVKVAPVWHALAGVDSIDARLLHTGQHYDHVLSDAFLEALELPRPDFFLGVGSGSHAQQTAGVLTGTETVLAEHRFDVTHATNDVIGVDPAAMTAAREELRRSFPLPRPTIPLWDGRAGVRAGESVATFVRRLRISEYSNLASEGQIT